MKRIIQVFILSLFLLSIPPIAYCGQDSKATAFPVEQAVAFLLQYRSNKVPVGAVISSMERHGYYLESEVYQGGTEAADSFKTILHGKFDVVITCDLQFNSNYARVKGLHIPFEENAFDLTYGRYVRNKFVREKTSWSDRENKPKPLVLRKILSNFKVTDICINVPDPGDDNTSEKAWRIYGTKVTNTIAAKLGKPSSTKFTWPRDYGEFIWEAQWRSSHISFTSGDNEDGADHNGIQLNLQDRKLDL